MKKSFNKVLSVFVFSFIFSNFLFGLLPGTQVLTANDGHKKVEDLDIGDLVSIYSIIDKNIEEEFKKIERVKVRKTKELVVIKTRAGVSIYGPNQKIYNRRIFKFIKSKDLRVGDILYSPELKNLEIEEIYIKKLKKKIGLYYVSIEDKCLFLALIDDNNHILLHNEVVTLTILAVSWGAGEITVVVAGVASVAAAAAGLIGLWFKRKVRKRGVDVGPWQDTNIGVNGDLFFGQSSSSMDLLNLRKSKGQKSPELVEVLEDAEKVKKKGGPSDAWKKKGGKKQKSRDFDKLNKGEIEYQETEKGTIKKGITSDGERIVDRDFSSDISGNEPTLEIQHGKRDYTKIRY